MITGIWKFKTRNKKFTISKKIKDSSKDTTIKLETKEKE